ncbi:MAG: (d)CMP kinase [Nitrospinae bacterium]|jgi:CMP/dCMP kinase|nr:(d)CMP kinase [Nitrospinota bacterium]MDA1110532.1 (d)CMP kinase [Nitrospinota bacterium]
MIIAIDGPAGSGKSSAAKIVAQKMQFRHINTGAMYRAVAWKAQQLGMTLDHEEDIAEVARNLNIQFIPGPEGQAVVVDEKDVTGLLRTKSVDQDAAIVASLGKVREILVASQRTMGKSGNIVMEGRDIGTVVFPEADKKFFLDATPEERGKRRYLELKAKNQAVDLDAIIEQVKLRDDKDRNRKVSPLKPAEDAICLDTTSLDLNEVVNHMMGWIQKNPTC